MKKRDINIWFFHPPLNPLPSPKVGALSQGGETERDISKSFLSLEGRGQGEGENTCF